MDPLKSSILPENRIDRYLLALLSLALLNFAYVAITFSIKGYLPEPFMHNKWDTFMDFYNPLFWANQDGIYTKWKSIYPPLNFIILRIYTILFIDNIEFFKNGLDLRQIFGIYDLFLIFTYSALVVLSVTKSFSKIFRINQVAIICVIVVLSPVFLFALERGNLIFISLYIFTLYVWSKNILSKAILFALLVNLKPYFLIIFIFELIRKGALEKNKEFLLLAPLISTLIFIITGALINQEYQQLIFNLIEFSTSSSVFVPHEIFAFPSSIISYSYLNLITGLNINQFILYIPKIIVYILLLKCIFLIIRKKISNDYFIIFIVLFLTNYSISSGGYTALYYIPIIPFLLVNKNYLLMNILVFSFFIGIWDMVSLFYLKTFDFQVYLSGKFEMVDTYLTLGSIIRPLANFFSLLLFYQILKGRYAK